MSLMMIVVLNLEGGIEMKVAVGGILLRERIPMLVVVVMICLGGMTLEAAVGALALMPVVLPVVRRLLQLLKRALLLLLMIESIIVSAGVVLGETTMIMIRTVIPIVVEILEGHHHLIRKVHGMILHFLLLLLPLMMLEKWAVEVIHLRDLLQGVMVVLVVRLLLSRCRLVPEYELLLVVSRISMVW